MNRYVSVVLAIALHSFLTSSVQAITDEPIRLGIEPRGSVEETVRMFTPLADYLSREMGRPVHIDVPENFDGFGQAISRKQYHLAFAAPATILYHTKADQFEWLAVAVDRKQGASLRGLFITQHNSPLKTIGDLKGKRIAFVDQSSQGYLVLSQLLRDAGIDPKKDIEPVFHQKLDRTVRALLENKADAAGVGDVIFSKLKGKIDFTQIRTIATSPPIPNWTMVGFDAHTNTKIQKALLQLDHQSIIASDTLGSSHFSGFQGPKPGEFDLVQRAAANAGNSVTH